MSRKPVLNRVSSISARGIEVFGRFLQFLQIDSAHHITDQRNHLFERFVWLLIILLSGFVSFYTCFNQWERYNANPTVISLERASDDSNWTLPAVTLCYDRKINQTKASEYVKRTWSVNHNRKDYQHLMMFIDLIANLRPDNLSGLSEYEGDMRLKFLNLRELAEMVYPKHDNIVEAFDKNAKFDMRQVMTERGICHIINAPISKLLSNEVTNSESDLSDILSCNSFKRKCFMRLDFFNESATIEVHSPDELPVYDSTVINMEQSVERLVTYKVIETFASDSLKSLTFQQRNCTFRSEIFLLEPKFSGRLCEMNCRAMRAMELCSCVPFTYPFHDGPECSLTGYICLQKKNWLDRMAYSCKCPISCVHYKFMEYGDNKQRHWTALDVPFRPKSIFRWKVLPVKMRNRRDVLFSFSDFIGAFGGATSLFLGINVWRLAMMTLKIIENVINLIQSKWAKP